MSMSIGSVGYIEQVHIDRHRLVSKFAKPAFKLSGFPWRVFLSNVEQMTNGLKYFGVIVVLGIHTDTKEVLAR